jgi:hypothetical protein
MNPLTRTGRIKKIFIFYPAFILAVFISFTSCTHGWKTYVVKSGHHSSGEINPIKLNFDKISFDFKADSTWYYNLPSNSGWNKIHGISHGHHQNNSSARLVYRCIDGQILEVGAYCYVNGKSPQENPWQKDVIDTIQPGSVYHCSISRAHGKYIIEFENKKWVCPAGKDLNWGYLLNPYIGGEFTLNHDWKVEIRDR